MKKEKEEASFLSSTSSPNKIRKKTAIINILVIIALPFFAFYLGYKNSNWLLQFVCLAAFPFVVYNAFKYFFKTDYRKHLNDYHDQQKALPGNDKFDLKNNLDFNYAGFFIRSLANIVDIAILSIILILLYYLDNMFGNFLFKGQTRNMIISVYLSLFLSLKNNTTPGKMIFGIRVINRNGQKLSSSRAISRSILLTFFIATIEILVVSYLINIAELKQRPLDDTMIITVSILSSLTAILIYSIICFLTSALSKENVTVHDFICSTRVVKILKKSKRTN